MRTTKYQCAQLSRSRHRLVCTLLLWALFGLAHQNAISAVTPETVAKQTWHRVSTPNFELITDISKNNAVELAERVERFRQFISIISSFDSEITLRPVTIFATKRGKNYDFFTKQSDLLNKSTGFFNDTIPATYAVIHLKGRHLAQHNLRNYYHQYVHYLTATSTSYDLPYWFSEGFAIYLASIEFIGKNKVHYAKPLAQYRRFIKNSRWVPIGEILADRRGQHRSIHRIRKTHAQGYFLTHYFYADIERRKNLLKFINLRNSGTEIEIAAQQAFDITLEELNSAVKHYAYSPSRMRYLSIELNKSLELNDLTVHKLRPEELFTEFALFSLRTDLGSDKAITWFEHALEINPLYAPALAGLAQTYVDQDLEKALHYFEQANHLAPNDVYVATVKGHVYRQLLTHKTEQTSDTTQKAAYWRQAVQGYDTAINSSTGNVEALVGAAHLYTGRQPDELVIELLRFAYQFAPSNTAVQKHLIRALLRNQNTLQADLIANIIRNNPHYTQHQLENFEQWYQELRAVYLRSEETQYASPVNEQHNSKQPMSSTHED